MAYPKIPISSFYPRQKHSSWVKVPEDEYPYASNAWKAPISYPEVSDESHLIWDEDAYQADNSKGWVEIE